LGELDRVRAGLCERGIVELRCYGKGLIWKSMIVEE
jgi:hypothetical protein